MALIPRANPDSVPPIAPLPGVRDETRFNPNPLGGLAAAATNLGRNIKDVVDTHRAQVAEQEQEVRQTLVFEKRNKLIEREQWWMNPENESGISARKGRNAIGLIEEVDADFAKLSGELAADLDEDGKRAFERVSFDLRDQVRRRVAGHVDEQIETFRTDTELATVSAGENRAATLAMAGDYAGMNRELDLATATLELQGQRRGLSAERVAESSRALVARTVEAATRGDIARDPRRALAMLDHRLGIKPGAPLSDGIAPSVTAGDPALYAAIAKAESNDRHVDDGGRVIRGPITATGERAVGRFQIMPATGPEAAKLAGVPWNPKKFESDESYHAMLGEAYIDAQVARFGGNVAAVAAAYNMGPEAAAGWVAGKPYKTASGKQWNPKRPMDPDAMPDETRAYIAKVTGALGAAPATAPAMTATPGKRPASTIPGSGPYEHLTVGQVVQLRSAAETEVRRLDQEAAKAAELGKITFAQDVDDRRTAFTAGEWSPIPDASEYVAAFGPERGVLEHQKDRVLQSMSGDLSALLNATPGEAAAIVERYKPTGTENREAKQFASGKILEQADRVQRARAADPMQFALAAKTGDVAPIDLSRRDGLETELAKRLPVATLLSRDYGTPYTLLTRSEATALAQRVGQLTSAEQVDLFRRVRNAVPDPAAYQSVMQQLRPDSPVSALAGSVLGVDGAVQLDDGPAMSADKVAQRILEGEQLLNPAKESRSQDGKGSFPMPPDDALRRAWGEYVGNAYRGAPEVEGTAFQAYRAFYAADAAAAGRFDGKFNRDTADRAARAASGGVIHQNGAALLLPWGMKETTFRDQLRANWRKLSAPGGRAAGVHFDEVSLLTVGDGRYQVLAGMGPLRDRDGRIVEISVTRGEWVTMADGTRERWQLPEATSGPDPRVTPAGAPR